MPLDPEHNLHPASVEAIVDLFPAPVAQDEVDDRQLVAFALGFSTDDERRRLLSQFIDSSDLRERLLAVHAALQAGGASDNPTMAVAIRERLAQALRVYGQLRSWSTANGWRGIQAANGPEAASARALLGSVGENIRLLFATPRLATQRAASSGSEWERSFYPGVNVRFFAEVDARGFLLANAQFHDIEPGAGRALTGKELYLELVDEVSGGSAPIGSAAVIEDGWAFVAEGFGAISGLRHGSLPSTMFRLSLDRSEPWTSSQSYLLATVLEDERVEVQPIPFDLVDGPRVVGGELKVTVAATEQILTQFRTYTLELFVLVGNALVSLGSADLAHWSDGRQTFSYPVDVDLEGPIPCNSVLHARLAKPKEMG
jgi:hypothetical protein